MAHKWPLITVRAVPVHNPANLFAGSAQPRAEFPNIERAVAVPFVSAELKQGRHAEPARIEPTTASIAQAMAAKRNEAKAEKKKRRALPIFIAQSKPAADAERKADGKGDAQPEPESVVAQALAWIKGNENKNTAASYGTYTKQWEQFLQSNGWKPEPATVVLFMKSLHERGLAIATINKSAISAIAAQYKFGDEKSPTTSPLVKAAQKVVKAVAKPEKQKKPLTAEMMLEIAKAAPATFKGIRDATLVILMMAALLRESEAASLRKEDACLEQIDGEETLIVLVRKSKVDQERRGHTILVGCACSEEHGDQLCPVEWYKKYQRLRDPSSEFLFHHQGKVDKLSNSTPNSLLKKLLISIGCKDPENYGSHSMRIGGSTEASENGIEVAVLKRVGNWKSDAVFRYIRPSKKTLRSVTKAIFASASSSSSSSSSSCL